MQQEINDQPLHLKDQLWYIFLKLFDRNRRLHCYIVALLFSSCFLKFDQKLVSKVKPYGMTITFKLTKIIIVYYLKEKLRQ